MMTRSPGSASGSVRAAAASSCLRTRSPARLTLGAAAKEAVPDIRKRALDLQAQVRLGNDPAAEKEAKIEAAKRQEAESFKAIADLYLAKQLKVARPNTYREEERICS
jgi:hypothetical protein